MNMRFSAHNKRWFVRFCKFQNLHRFTATTLQQQQRKASSSVRERVVVGGRLEGYTKKKRIAVGGIQHLGWGKR